MKFLNLPARLISCGLAACLMVSLAGAEETGTLKVTFKFKGTPPAPGTLDPNKDKEFCGKHEIPDETLIVHPENNGIQNVMVYVYTGRRGTELPPMEMEPQTHVLANQACRFEPHVLIARAGDTIRVTNPDTVGHNANFAFFNNKAQNLTVPAGGEVQVVVGESEPAAIPVACNIHEWMLAHLLVLDHPFASISDENGVLTIEGLPVGKEIVFRAGHERASFKEITLNGEEEGWRSNKFTVEIEPGVNDLGIVEIDADAID